MEGYHVAIVSNPTDTALNDLDAAAAAGLRTQFGFLRDVVLEMERSVPYAAALMREGEGLELDLRDGGQSSTRHDPTAGVVLTASNGHSLEELSIDRTDPDSVRAAASDLVSAVRAQRLNGSEPALDIAAIGPTDADYATPTEIDPGSLSLADKLERFEATRRQLRDLDPHAVQASANYDETLERCVFVNRAGMATQQLRRTTFFMTLFVSDGQQQRFDYLLRGGTGGLEQIEIGESDMADTAETAVALLSARPMPAGTHDIVAEGSVSGTIAHEAFGHGVETDMFLRQRARAADFIGRRVGSDLVTIIDDPTAPGGYGGYYVDDEGQVATPTVIIREGIFQRGLTDLYSATRLGMARSANGRRESVDRKAYARMSNTFFARGESTPEDLLASLDHGFLVCRLLSGMEDPKGWGMQMTANVAREYRHGRPTGATFGPVTMTGYVPDILAGVSMVANDFTLWPGTCGKGWKERIPNGSGGPHIRTRLRLG